jgi:hypothetical protein
MSPGKVVAAVYCAGVLAIQAGVICTTAEYHEYYWPFLNYPMYSRSFGMGEQIRHARLMLQPCDSSTPPIEMTFQDAHLTRYEFQYRVHRAAGARKNTSPNAARNARLSLTELAHANMRVPICRMDVWMKLFRIGPDGLELPGTPWMPYLGWNVRGAVITDSALVAPPRVAP